MTQNDQDLTRRQRRAISALLTYPTVEAAAAACGLARQTLFRYLADDRFKLALAQAETEAIAQAARQMAGGASEAVAALRQVLENPDSTPGERIKAARALLAALPSLRLLGSIEQRLSDLQGESNETDDDDS